MSKRRGSITRSSNTKTLTVDCPEGKKVAGGGGSTSVTTGQIALFESRPVDGDTWQVSAAENNSVSGNWTLTVYATCIS